MDLVVTLIDPVGLDPTLAATIVKALAADHAVRLSHHATDIYAVGQVADVRARVADALEGAAVDAIVQPVEGRRKQLLVSDMDSTLIGEECIDELAAVHDLKPRVAAITARAMAGELDFEAALVERVALLRGIPEASIAQLLARVITPSPGAAVMIATLKAKGVRTVLVSGGFTQFAEPIKVRLGLDAAHANRLLVADGLLSGHVAMPILGPAAKHDVLMAECATLGIAPSAAVALGDGANDLPMITAAGLGLAYRAKPSVAAAADGEIRNADLTAVLYALGIGDDEFAPAPAARG